MNKTNSGSGLTRREMEELLRRVNSELRRHPPVIGLIGVSGVGKSSTINTLFKTDLATSDTVACTKEFWDTDVSATFSQSGVHKSVLLRVIDAPGLGEDLARDPAYLEMYRRHLSRCDVILWVLAARNRAVALDQHYLKQLEEFHGKMVFGLNQVDLVEPMDWDGQINLPSPRQETNIEIIVRDRREKLESILRREIKMVAYSAKDRYQLQELFSAIVEACPPDRKWIFSALKGFRVEDFIPVELRERVLREAALAAPAASGAGVGATATLAPGPDVPPTVKRPHANNPPEAERETDAGERPTVKTPAQAGAGAHAAGSAAGQPTHAPGQTAGARGGEVVAAEGEWLGDLLRPFEQAFTWMIDLFTPSSNRGANKEK